MKIGILTLFQIHNHGGMLQMFALAAVLKQMGHQIVELTYNRNYDFIESSLRNKYNLSLKSFSIYKQYFRENGIKKTLFNFKKHNQLNRFKKRNFTFQALYPEHKNLDAICIGSDEAFSLEVGCSPWMYSHTLTAPLLFSYAPSFGQTNANLIDKRACRELIASGLKRFHYLSVRDVFSFQTVKELTGLEAEVVCDPVLLYGFKKEIAETRLPILPPNYLVVYAYDRNMNAPDEVTKIKKYAKEMGLPIVSAGYYHKWADINLNVDPLELLGVFKKATSVITDTFHGSVLSLITNTSFACLMRPINTNKMTALLDMFDAQQAQITDFEQLKQHFSVPLDWETINRCILENRTKGENFLRKVLDGK